MNKQSIALTQSVQQVFEQHFDYAPTHIIQAPGRVNLIGEHTDYNDGFVLPCAIDYQTVVAAATRSDSLVRVIAVDYDNARNTFDLSQPLAFDPDCMWVNYIRGVLKGLLEKG